MNEISRQLGVWVGLGLLGLRSRVSRRCVETRITLYSGDEVCGGCFKMQFYRSIDTVASNVSL